MKTANKTGIALVKLGSGAKNGRKTLLEKTQQYPIEYTGKNKDYNLFGYLI